MSVKSKLRAAIPNLLLLGVVTGLTLWVTDLILIRTGLFPPRVEPGNARVGWVAAVPTGAMRTDRCLELSGDSILSYPRNEDGVRTDVSATELVGRSARYEVVVSGDSHTDLCAPNALTHFGYTQSGLEAAGLPAAVYAYGAGKYSPLQAYLAIEPLITKYAPDAFILNLYTGNDFYDLMRVDDRPYFVSTDTGYIIAPPVWYQLDAPDDPPRSRVMFAGREIAKAVGVHNIALRLRYLRKTAAEQQQGIGAVLRYMNDLRRSSIDGIGYPQAYSAQMLNQQLFFHHFPASREESVRRARALLQLIRARHPDLLLILSPVPSYELVQQTAPDSLLARILERLPVDFAGGVAEEDSLYSGLRTLATETGWVFVDNLTPLRGVTDRRTLYNHHDLHLQPAASALIGAAQAAAIEAALERTRGQTVR